MRIALSILGICLALCTSCYTLNGISIPDNINTYTIGEIKILPSNAPPLIDQIFADDLRQKINSQTKLTQNNQDPDVEFSGEITQYKLEFLAPTATQLSSLNRLKVTINIEYTNNVDEEGSWKQAFTQNFDFSADQELLSIQDQAIAEIYEQIIEQIFNKSFANW